MTQEQLKLNSELFGLLQEICASETLMAKGIKALKRVLKNKDEDDTLMTEEELNEKLECNTMLANEDLTEYLKRRGHEI